MKYLEIIEKLHPDIIHHFLSTGECQGIPVEVQRFLKQMQWAAEIYEYERNITRAAGMLRNRIKAQQGLDVDVRTCKSRIYSAINYFSIDNNVSVKVWENDFADKYEDLALLAIDAGEYKRPPRPAKMPLWNAVVGRARLRKKTVRGLRYSSFLPKSRPKSWVSRNGVSRRSPGSRTRVFISI